MGLLVRWRGTGMPTGNNTPSGCFFAGDNGTGDTPGPSIVESENNLQSRPFIQPNTIWPAHGQCMELNQFVGAPMWVAWHLKIDTGAIVPFSNGYHIRMYVQGYGKAITPSQNGVEMIHAVGPQTDQTGPNSRRKWSIQQRMDQTLGRTVYSPTAGFYTVYDGRQFGVRDNVTNGFTGYTTWQSGGNARYGLWEWGYRVEIRVSPTGFLEAAWFEDWVDPDVPRDSHAVQLSEWDIDTISIHNRYSTGNWLPDLKYDNIEVWDDYDANTWKGPYEPHDAYFEEVTAPGVTVSTTVEGELTSRNPDVITPLNWSFNEEYVLPPFVYMPDQFRDDSGNTDYYSGSYLGIAFLPDPTKFAGPHPWATWGHSGFFQRGTPSAIIWSWVAELCARGIAVFAIRYPLCDRPPLVANSYAGQVKHPLQIIGYKSQWKFLEDNARNGDNRYNLDPDLGFMMGYSAGGNLAQAAAMSRNCANANGYDLRLRTDGTDPNPVGVFTHAAPVNWQRLVAEDSTGFIAQDTARAYMQYAINAGVSGIYPTSIHYLPGINQANIGDLECGYVLGTQDALLGPGNLTDLEDAWTAIGKGAQFEGHMITSDHDNIDTVADPTDPVNGCLQWFERVLGANMPQEIA